MSAPTMEVVQFVHPGFEYHAAVHVGRRGERSGVMASKPGRSKHDRKFMVSEGSLFDWRTGQDHPSVPLVFWGEWEGPSVFWRIESLGKPRPTILHAPFRPVQRPEQSVQNTDPMVFGDAFIYSNCMQQTYVSLRNLSPGSIVLFGRYSKPNGIPAFSLDTCLVIGTRQVLTPVPLLTPGGDLLTDAVLGPLYTEGFHDELNVYFGRRRSEADSGSFSFFPAQLASTGMPLFARPELRPDGELSNVISSGNMQGIKLTPGLSPTRRDAIWAEVAKQVTDQCCSLGYHALAPPLLDYDQAVSVAEELPKPLGISV